MNRRGFLGTLLAAPIAAVMGLKRKGPIGLWGREIFKRHRHTATTYEWTKIVGEVKYDKAFLDCMPETKSTIDEQWRRYDKAMKDLPPA